MWSRIKFSAVWHWIWWHYLVSKLNICPKNSTRARDTLSYNSSLKSFLKSSAESEDRPKVPTHREIHHLSFSLLGLRNWKSSLRDMAPPPPQWCCQPHHPSPWRNCLISAPHIKAISSISSSINHFWVRTDTVRNFSNPAWVHNIGRKSEKSLRIISIRQQEYTDD